MMELTESNDLLTRLKFYVKVNTNTLKSGNKKDSKMCNSSLKHENVLYYTYRRVTLYNYIGYHSSSENL